MQKIVECVPNFSEGRDPGIIRRITDQIEGVNGVRLLNVDPGESTNRTVVTFIGPPDAVLEAAFRAVKEAADLIDMRSHHGEHPRMGAADVVPFVPVSGVTMEDCVEIARTLGERVGNELGIPVYLYENAATRAERRNLSTVRAGEYEGLPEKLADQDWKPDFGPSEFNPKSGATAVGAREFLIAYNINLNIMDRKYAADIAYELRERGRWKRTGNTTPFYYKGKVVYFKEGVYPCGNCKFEGEKFEELAEHYEKVHGGDLNDRYRSIGLDPEHLTDKPVYKDGKFKHVKAVGWVVEDYRKAQISINLTNYRVTPPHLVLEEARRMASDRGIVVSGSEIVGVVPFDCLLEAGRYYLKKMLKSTGIPTRDILETAVQSMGLRDVADFDIDEKVIGLPEKGGPLVCLAVDDFVDEVSRDTPAPGGGSIAALAGSLGAALASMVANLSYGSKGSQPIQEEILSIAEGAQEVKDELVSAIDADTEAFNAVLEAMRMPKDTKEQEEARTDAIRSGYKEASRVPLRTAELCGRALDLCLKAARTGNRSVLSDAGVGALMAFAGVQGAAYNVLINLPHTGDGEFNGEVTRRLDSLLEEAKTTCEAVRSEVEAGLKGSA
jgi:glutamate formiminotransferase/formiminotetrahydrofolate cyclodeaminase